MITRDINGRLLYIGDVATLTDGQKTSIDQVLPQHFEETFDTQVEDLRRGR